MKKVITACVKNGDSVLLANEIEISPQMYGTLTDKLEREGCEAPFVHVEINEEQYPGVFRTIFNSNNIGAAFADLRERQVAAVPPPANPAVTASTADTDNFQWRKEFPADYAVPAEIERLVRFGYVDDVSWHNDAMPSFDHWNPVSRTGFKVWVDHVNPAERENDGWTRFAVYPLLTDGPADPVTGDQAYQMGEQALLTTDDLPQLLAFVAEQMHGLKVGQRAKFTSDLDRYPNTIIRAGNLGTVTTVDPFLIGITLDEKDEGLNEWNNEAHFYPEDLDSYKSGGPDVKFDPKKFHTIGDVVRDYVTVLDEIKPTVVGS